MSRLHRFRLGFQGKILTSFPLCPVLRRAQETMTFVFSFISKLDGAKILTLPLDDLVTFSDLVVPPWEYEADAAIRSRK